MLLVNALAHNRNTRNICNVDTVAALALCPVIRAAWREQNRLNMKGIIINVISNIPVVDATTAYPLKTRSIFWASIAFEELASPHHQRERRSSLLLDTLDQEPPETPPTVGDLLEIDRSVERTLRNVLKNQMLLQFKLEDTLSITTTSTSTTSSTTTEIA